MAGMRGMARVRPMSRQGVKVLQLEGLEQRCLAGVVRLHVRRGYSDRLLWQEPGRDERRH
ncbi:hypothetical protein D3C72_2385240 [compost metagenome]